MTAHARATARDAHGMPNGKGAGLRSPGRVRFMGVLLILLSLIPAVASYTVFSWWLPSDAQRYRDYRAAEPCSARDSGLEQTECLSSWRLTVEKTVNGGKAYKATLTDQDSWRGTVSFGDPGPLLERLKSGDQVTATAWRRGIVALRKDGVRQDTSEAPRDEVQMNAAVGMIAALVAAQLFIFGAVRLARPRDHGPFTWNPYGRRLLITIAAVCFGVGLSAVWTGMPWWSVSAASVSIVVCAAVVTHHRLHRAAASP
ncbi:hypothetical protein [Streptomyces flavofungini]|uniref:hypothetical protein n=1 Tax=Streptomyces flavofungini TaxID=68200 RepID=UPI0025B1EBEE|nr:hypothetical protein [Streptomyces flavofungini]WJV45364.1 hypothetical protein QUY26_07310 [Streptomyces flavofungini]